MSKWKLKVLAQFFLAHAPFGEAINYRLQLMNSLGDDHRFQVRLAAIGNGLRRLTKVTPIGGTTVVEVGTGWDALPTLMLYAAGAKHIHTYDHVRHLRADLMVAALRRLAANAEVLSVYLDTPVAVIKERLGRALAVSGTGLPGLLSMTNISYHAPGDAANTGLAGRSIDIYYSYTVLEHVPKNIAAMIATEAGRVLKPEGTYYAAIWLHDQYSSFDPTISPVNFLRYPEWVWGVFIKNKISYHNRLRERDFLDILGSQHAEILKVTSILDEENVQHVKSIKVDKRFAAYSAEELAVTFTEIMARWGQGPATPR
jgi:SAM-dependent methyltransferase